jgi:polysaccharide pyruvyl transferase WcaK-like protein
MKIGFFGHFGTLNTGNESTLVAILSHLRSLFPDGEFCCICTNPEVVTARDGIEAVPISSRDVRIWDRESRLDRRIRTAFVGMREEVKEYSRAFRTLKGTDMLIIPGTGLLTDAFGLSAWGPYNLFKWSFMARLRRCKILFVSVGVGPLDSAPGRFLVKSALSLADYRSYRDDPSLKYLRDIGFRVKRDRVYPDLVFGLPERLLPADESKTERRRVVGLGLMLYDAKYSAANPTRETYTRYLEALAVFVDWLIADDYDVRLLLGDGDTLVIQEFRSLLRARLGAYDEARVVDQPITSVEQVLSQLARSDFVVATRFHNVLLAFLLEKPVIAISFHSKCSSLMNQMGLSEYCHDIDDMNVDRLIAQFQELKQHREGVRRIVTESVEEAREALDEQYDLLFNHS